MESDSPQIKKLNLFKLELLQLDVFSSVAKLKRFIKKKSSFKVCGKAERRADLLEASA